MTVEKLREIDPARPLTPFTLHRADGRSVRVLSPGFMAFRPGGRLAHVFYEGDRSSFFDLLLVTSVERSNSTGPRRRRRAG